jgi:hypothetical protein
MSPLDWLAPTAGLGLILLSSLDLFLTVLHTDTESPISSRVLRGFWGLWVGLSRRLPTGLREEALSWGAPLMIAGNIGFWVAGFILGFAGLYLPLIHGPGFFSIEPPVRQTAPGDALYFSAVTFFTIGYGDISPIHPLTRLASTAQGGFGLLTISLAVTYLLSVFPIINRKRTLAVALNNETGGRTDALIIVERYVCPGRFEALGDHLRALNEDLLSLAQAHAFFPVLYYVRPRQVGQSFARVLAIVQGLVTTLRYGLDPKEHAEVVNDPRLIELEEGLLYALHGLAEAYHLSPHSETGDEASRARENLHALARGLAERGLRPVSPADPESAARHERFRLATDRYIRAYAGNLGFEAADLWATHDPRERDVALVSRTELESKRPTGC